MSLLTELPGLPAPHPGRVAPHRMRVVDGKVLAVSEPGHWAFLTPAEYADYLRGLEDSHPRFDELRVKGFLGHYMEFDGLAADAMEGSLLSWEGTRTHVVLLERDGKTMSPDMLREVVDFAFTVPGPAVVLELVCEDPEAIWKTACFGARYARRRSEWNGRRSRLWLRTPVLPKKAEPGLGVRLVLDAEAAPRLKAVPPQDPPPRALLRWSPGAERPAAWAAALRKAGCGSVLLSPEDVRVVDEAPEFAAFYAAFLDALLADGPPLREEWAAAALRRLPPENGRPREERGAPPAGVDVAGELCFTPWGELLSSERALGLPADDRALYSLGAVGHTAYEELPGKDAVRALLAAAEGDHHPLCTLCAYKNACVVAPSRHAALQGRFWGHLPTSPACRAQMAALDVLFARLADEPRRETLLGWADNWTLL